MLNSLNFLLVCVCAKLVIKFLGQLHHRLVIESMAELIMMPFGILTRLGTPIVKYTDSLP